MTKRYLIPIVIVLVLASGVLIGCSSVPPSEPTPTKTPIEIYLNQALPIIDRHNETLEAIDRAMEAIASEAEKPSADDPSKTQLEAIELPKP